MRRDKNTDPKSDGWDLEAKGWDLDLDNWELEADGWEIQDGTPRAGTTYELDVNEASANKNDHKDHEPPTWEDHHKDG